MMEIIKKVWLFTKKPSPNNKSENLSFKGKLLEDVYVVLFYFSLAFLASMPLIALTSMIKHFYHVDLIMIRDNHIKFFNNKIVLFFIMVFIGPLFEETVFRLWLSLKKLHLFIGLSTAGYLFLVLEEQIRIYSFIIDKAFYQNITISLLFGAVITLLTNIKVLGKLTFKYYKYFYWASCFGFALMHMINFRPLQINIFWVYPFLVLPQLILGILLGYVRMKNGFFWSFLMHCMVNFIPGLIMLVSNKI